MDIGNAKQEFTKYAEAAKKIISELPDEIIRKFVEEDNIRTNKEQNVTQDDIVKKREQMIKMIDTKVIHSEEVAQDSEKTAEEFGFNSEITSFVKLSGLLHDIGRFDQNIMTGNYMDFDLNQKYPEFHDHGELGRFVLNRSFLTKICPVYPDLERSVTTIVGEHAKGTLPPSLAQNVTSLKVYANFSIPEVMANAQFMKNLEAITVQIIQDVDRLDIYHQIIAGTWKPMIVEEKISDEVFDRFFRGEYLDMQKLRGVGLWNANVGELVRLSFVGQLKLVGVAKAIEQEKIIEKMYQVRDIDGRSSDMPRLKEAYEFAQDNLRKIIAQSQDGIYLPGKQK